MNDTVNTHDLLRPTATRATGTRAWVWYVVIGAFALIVIVYLTNIFMAKTPGVTPMSSSGAVNSPPIAQASEQFRYSGEVVTHPEGVGHREQAVPRTDGAAAPNPPLPTVPPVRQAYGTSSAGSYVPDVSTAAAADGRIPLPTPNPNDGAMNARASGVANVTRTSSAQTRGIQVVYGAPATADGNTVQMVSASQSGVGAAPAIIAQSTPAAGGLAARDSETMPGKRRAPTAKYMVTGGTRIFAATEGYIESDMPGPVTAKTTAPVIDQLTGEVLIPAGAEVLGYYGGLAQDATALNIGWTRLLFPDQSSIALDKLPALNEDGHMGVSGSYDDHRGKLFRSTFIGAILSGVAQRFLGTGSTTTNIYVKTGTGTSAQPYAASAQMVIDLVNQLNSRDSQVPPTIVIPANTPVEIYVDRDVIFDGPYRPMKAAS